MCADSELIVGRLRLSIVGNAAFKATNVFFCALPDGSLRLSIIGALPLELDGGEGGDASSASARAASLAGGVPEVRIGGDGLMRTIGDAAAHVGSQRDNSVGEMEESFCRVVQEAAITDRRWPLSFRDYRRGEREAEGKTRYRVIDGLMTRDAGAVEYLEER